jgi:hypothetical protein
MSRAKEMEDIQYLLSVIDTAGLRSFHALSGDHCCNAISVVFFDAVHARPTRENIFSFPLYVTCFSRMLKQSASLSCLFGLFG